LTSDETWAHHFTGKTTQAGMQFRLPKQYLRGCQFQNNHKGKEKGKVHPITCHDSKEEGIEVNGVRSGWVIP
jgi:hypothetical protein